MNGSRSTPIAEATQPPAQSRQARAFRWFLLAGRVLLAMVVVYLLAVLFLPITGGIWTADAPEPEASGKRRAITAGSRDSGDDHRLLENANHLPAGLFAQPGEWIFDSGPGIGLETASKAEVERVLARPPAAIGPFKKYSGDNQQQQMLLTALTAGHKESRVVRNGNWEATLMKQKSVMVAVIAYRDPSAGASDADGLRVVEIRTASPQADGTFRIVKLPMTSSGDATDAPLAPDSKLMPLLPGDEMLGSRMADGKEISGIFRSDHSTEELLRHWRGKGWLCHHDKEAGAGKLYNCQQPDTGQSSAVSFLPADSGSLFLVTAY